MNNNKKKLLTDISFSFFVGVATSVITMLIALSCYLSFTHENPKLTCQKVIEGYSSLGEIQDDYKPEQEVYVTVLKEYPSSKEVEFKKYVGRRQDFKRIYYIDNDLNYSEK